MSEFRIILEGKFYEKDIEISRSPSNRKIDPIAESEIDSIWEETLKDAKINNKIAYNGTSYRLNDFKIEDNKLSLDFSVVSFKVRSGLRKTSTFPNLSEEYFHKACSAGSIVQTSDGKFVMIKLSGKSLSTLSTDVLGGMMEYPYPLKNGTDLFDQQYREMYEEGRIRKEDISDIYLRNLIQCPGGQVLLSFQVTLSVSSDEVRQRFDSEESDPDIAEILIFDRDDYIDMMQNHESVSKQLMIQS